MNEKTLVKNKVNQFILRIDLPKDSRLDLRQLALDLRDDYIRIVENTEHNFNLNVDNYEVTQRDFINYTLYAENGVQLTINNSVEKFIVFEAKTYLDNGVYIDRLDAIIKKISNQEIEEVFSSRIGMRYVNIFPCERVDRIKKILQAPNDKEIVNLLRKDQLNRAVVVEEFNCGDYQVRVQYGIFNKFYPSVVKNYDITLDIDVYYGAKISIAEWKEVIRTYNHAAYAKFIEYVSPNYIEEMRDE